MSEYQGSKNERLLGLCRLATHPGGCAILHGSALGPDPVKRLLAFRDPDNLS